MTAEERVRSIDNKKGIDIRDKEIFGEIVYYDEHGNKLDTGDAIAFTGPDDTDLDLEHFEPTDEWAEPEAEACEQWLKEEFEAVDPFEHGEESAYLVIYADGEEILRTYITTVCTLDDKKKSIKDHVAYKIKAMGDKFTFEHEPAYDPGTGECIEGWIVGDTDCFDDEDDFYHYLLADDGTVYKLYYTDYDPNDYYNAHAYFDSIDYGHPNYMVDITGDIGGLWEIDDILNM